MRTLICLVVAVACVGFTLANPKQRDGLDCEMCKLAVGVVTPMLGQDTEDIKKEFDAECKKAFGHIPFGTTECRHFIDTKLDPIIKELESGTAPKDVCVKLAMC